MYLQGKFLEVGLLDQKINAGPKAMLNHLKCKTSYVVLLNVTKFSTNELYTSGFPPEIYESVSTLFH